MTKLPDILPDAAEVDAKLRAGNMVFWLETEALKHGTDNQRERHTAGVLPEDELLALARGELYKPLNAWTRWKNRDLHAREVRHEDSCAGAEQLVKYRTLGGPAMPPMDGNAWNRLGELRHAVNEIAAHEWLTRSHAKVDVQVTRHEAYCTRCNKVAVRYAVRVAIPWAGHTLVREYAL